MLMTCVALCLFHRLSTRHWLMKQLSAVHAKSLAFGATTQDLHSEPLCETSSVETVATRPDSVAQNAFTANKTHVSDTTRCCARQCKECPSEHLPVCFAGLLLRLLETCDQQLSEILFRVPTMVTHIGQKQFVHNWTAPPSNANQVLLPTREGLIHLFFRNQQVSLGGTAPQRRLSVRRHQCAPVESFILDIPQMKFIDISLIIVSSRWTILNT